MALLKVYTSVQSVIVVKALTNCREIAYMFSQTELACRCVVFIFYICIYILYESSIIKEVPTIRWPINEPCKS